MGLWSSPGPPGLPPTSCRSGLIALSRRQHADRHRMGPSRQPRLRRGQEDQRPQAHIAAGTIGLLLTVLITAAGVQDRDGARPLLWNLRKAFPSVRLTWADGGYAGKLVTWARSKLKPRLTLEIVRWPDDLHTFQVLPRRWVAGRTLAWITRCRRTVRDYERLPAPRNHSPLGDDHHHDPAPGPPATSGSIQRYLVPRQAASTPSRPRQLRGSAGANSASGSCGRHRVD